MKNLYLKTVAAILVAVLLSFALMIGFVIVFQPRISERHEGFVKNSGYLFVYQKLRSKSVKQLDAWIQQHQKHFSAFLSVQQLAPDTLGQLKPLPNIENGEVLFERRRDKFSIFFPLRETGSFFVVRSSLKWTHPPFKGFLLHMGILAILIFAFIGILLLPIARHFRRFERATSALSQAQWEVQVPIDSNDAFGHLARSFNKMAQRIRHLIQDREELLQAVSHELGTPLSRMQFSLELLEAASDEKARRRHMDSLAEELRELEHLSTELINWLEADSPNIRKHPHELTPILSQLIEQMNEDTPEALSLSFEHSGELCAPVEQRQFQRAIENLLRNAVRHAHSRVLLKATQEEKQIRIEIRDDGEGIPTAQRDKIFDPFVSFWDREDGGSTGAGLGLSIVQRIVRRHNGSVSLEKAPEGGANFITEWLLEETEDLPV